MADIAFPCRRRHSAIIICTSPAADPKRKVHSWLRPNQCYQSPVLSAGHKLWGFSVQLYTLRSSSNCGIGDFADLIALINAAASHGCNLIGLNPLHALRPAAPNQISPYSPSSRDFINVLYIAVTGVPEYIDCIEAQRWVNEASTATCCIARDQAC